MLATNRNLESTACNKYKCCRREDAHFEKFLVAHHKNRSNYTLWRSLNRCWIDQFEYSEILDQLATKFTGELVAREPRGVLHEV